MQKTHILEFAALHAPEMPIHWGEKGFSLNVNLDGTDVAVFFCYPPTALFGQSIYTKLSGLGGMPSTQVPDDEIKNLYSKAKATGVFRPASAGQELRCSIDRVFTDKEVGEILAWCEDLPAIIAKYGLKE